MGAEYQSPDLVLLHGALLVTKRLPLCTFAAVGLVALTFLADLSQAHVALTFPQARHYNLDFLDNGRTKAPCGMPKGEYEI